MAVSIAGANLHSHDHQDKYGKVNTTQKCLQYNHPQHNEEPSALELTGQGSVQSWFVPHSTRHTLLSP